MKRSLSTQVSEFICDIAFHLSKDEEQFYMNTFRKDDLVFDYSKLNSRYHAASSPDEEIIVYKGAPKGFETKGLSSLALLRGFSSQINSHKRIIESKDDKSIRELFDEHTSYYRYTALLSATLNPEMAQVFAPTNPLTFAPNAKNNTIYQIKIKANRCVVDYFDTGNCGSNLELLILGAIFPDEISAVKIINDDAHSELVSECGQVIRRRPENYSRNRFVKDESNWKIMKHD